jgi:hypothetical protein
MNKYERLLADLERQGWGKMKCFGNSMLPKLDNPTMNTYIPQDEYEVGDIVFCKVKGKFIDSHLITQKNDSKGYMISNNKNHQNGWTTKVYGRVVKAINNNKEEKYFNFTEEELIKITKNKPEEMT